MFTKMMPSLLDKGILISDLVDSKIFGMRFDFDGWPSTHTEEDKLLRGFSDSLFTLRYKYNQIFPEEKFAAIDEDDPENAGKIFKVVYKINLLPMIDLHVAKDKNGERIVVNEGFSFLKDCIGGDEIEVFSIANMQDLIEFKWTSFALSFHTLGFYLHLFYISVLTVYTHVIYINDS